MFGGKLFSRKWFCNHKKNFDQNFLKKILKVLIININFEWEKHFDKKILFMKIFWEMFLRKCLCKNKNFQTNVLWKIMEIINKKCHFEIVLQVRNLLLIENFLQFFFLRKVFSRKLFSDYKKNVWPISLKRL